MLFSEEEDMSNGCDVDIEELKAESKFRRARPGS